MNSDDPTPVVNTAMLADLQELLGPNFTELVNAFIIDGERRLEQMRQALVSDNLDVLYEQSHGLKGSCQNIGAQPLADSCAQLEKESRAKLNSDKQTLFAAIEQQFADVVEALKAFQAAN